MGEVPASFPDMNTIPQQTFSSKSHHVCDGHHNDAPPRGHGYGAQDIVFPRFPALSHVTSRHAIAIAETAGFR